MSKHNKTGVNGELIAEEFLKKKGYIIMFKNWRSGHHEIDLVVQTRDIVVFVEVKTRSRAMLSFPEESVTAKKKQNLRTAAGNFAEQYPQYRNYRFDIISVLMQNGQPGEVVHFEEAFY
jgi:putative endonuclease